MIYVVVDFFYIRFHKPLPLRSWEGTLDATTFGPKCPQMRVSNVSSVTPLEKTAYGRGLS